MAEEVPASDETKRARRPLIAKAAVRNRKSIAMYAAWQRRRAELRSFEEGDDRDDERTESVGNVDAELADLPELI